MAASPFAFYRGAAAVMAADLAKEPATGLDAQICGDAHLSNFGAFQDPGRELVFDLNDFDETHQGPFEWDLKRLVASFEVAARERGFDRKRRREIVRRASSSYRTAMHEFASMRLLDIWHSRLGISDFEQRWGAEASARAVKNFRQAATKAKSKDHLKAFGKLTRRVDGEIRFVSDPPLLEPVSELFSDLDARLLDEIIASSLHSYRRTLPRSRQRLLDGYRFVDLARKVVGVGSVGTRCWVALMLGRDENDPLFLQVKEAEPSVLEAHRPKSKLPNHGQRVVEGQFLMQAASDILLGWDRTPGPDGVARDFYMRQLWDWKASADLETMPPDVMTIYAEVCGWTLARAHARSGDPVAIAAYLGSGSKFDDVMVRFADAYADQNERDHRAYSEAVAAGHIEAMTGI